MEYTKESIKVLKEAIKFRVADQKATKPQRKTVHFQGTRTLEPYVATLKHASNRWDLRHLYIAYGFMRGKTIDQIELKRKTSYNEEVVKRVIDSYGKVVHTDS
jgi:hypothetical protein